MVEFAAVWEEESLKTIRKRRFRGDRGVSAIRSWKEGFWVVFVKNLVYIVAGKIFENHGLSGCSTAVEMYGTVVLVIFRRLLEITGTVAVTTMV